MGCLLGLLTRERAVFGRRRQTARGADRIIALAGFGVDPTAHEGLDEIEPDACIFVHENFERTAVGFLAQGIGEQEKPEVERELAACRAFRGDTAREVEAARGDGRGGGTGFHFAVGRRGSAQPARIALRRQHRLAQQVGGTRSDVKIERARRFGQPHAQRLRGGR